MGRLKILAGDYPKGYANFDAAGISFLRAGKLPKKAYFIDVESVSENSSGTIEIRFFDGRRILVEEIKDF